MAKVGVLIGRFQGYHLAHHEILSKAALDCDLLVVIIGSRNKRSSISNPFSADERCEMIRANIKADPELASCRFEFYYANDNPDNKVWARRIKNKVNDLGYDDTTLYGCEKDESSFYLNLFPEWKLKLFPILNQGYSATDLRRDWLSGLQTCHSLVNRDHVPDATFGYLAGREFDENLQDEWDFYQKEKERFASYPYPETLTFCCGDSVLTCHDHVLMIKRKFTPGKDCWALPGGFKNRNESFYQAAVRELYEEAQLGFPRDQLECCERVNGRKMFDSPSRSQGIPRCTMAVYFDISCYFKPGDFPEVNPADDAADYNWIKISDLTHLRNIYDDHAAIVLSYK